MLRRIICDSKSLKVSVSMSSQFEEKSARKWEEIRLFISSTFRDMHAERDYLVRFVFPRIREELLKRRLYFIDIDLRWGLNAEDDIVGACRSIIDECHPLFMAILGGRYGWIPEHSEDHISITEDEIEHALSNITKGQAQRSLFFLFRDETTTRSIPDRFAEEFRELPGSKNYNKLLALKERIKRSHSNVATYRAVWNDHNQSLTQLDEFGELVYRNIMNFVEAEFKADSFYKPNGVDEDQDALDLYISQKSKFFITKGLESSLTRLEALVNRQAENNLIFVTGSCGIGKSAFLCKFIENTQMNKDLKVVPHFIGVNARSGELNGTLTRLCRLIAEENGSQEPMPYELDKLILFFQKLLAGLPKEKQYILIIDGINQLSPFNGAHELLWLPETTPANLTLILSATPCPIAETVRSRWRTLQEIELMGLPPDSARDMILYYLRRYQKKLSTDQIQTLLKKAGAHVPLYLSAVIEEMRIYGDYDGLSRLIRDLPDNTVALLEWVFTSRLTESKEFIDAEGQCISSSLVSRYLTYLYISQSGLSEAELAEVLGSAAVFGNVAALTRQLRPYLALRGELLTFYHDDIRTAVDNVYISNRDVRIYHEQLAGYFQKKCDPDDSLNWNGDSVRPFEQLLYHRLEAHNVKELTMLIGNDFLKKYSQLGAPAVVLQSIRDIVKVLTDDSGENHWDVLLICLGIFAELSGKISGSSADKPHPLERALAEGRDDEVMTLLSSFAAGGEGFVLRRAVRTYYKLVGRENRAAAIEEDPPELVKQYPQLSLQTQWLYEAVVGQENGTESSKPTSPIECEAQKTEDEATPTPRTPVKTISLGQVFALTALGKYRDFYGITIVAVVFLAALFAASPLYSKLEHIKLWGQSQPWIISTTVVTFLTIIFGIPVLAAPYFALKLAKSGLSNFLVKRSKLQLAALIEGINYLPKGQRLNSVLTLTRYGRLLNLAKIPEEDWDLRETADLLREEILEQVQTDKWENAGLLVACALNLGRLTRCVLAKALGELPKDIIYEVLLKMLDNNKIILNKKYVLEYLREVYQSTPPITILLPVLLILKNDDGDDVLNYLRDVDKKVLVSSLLRSANFYKSKSELERWSRLKRRGKKALEGVRQTEPIPYTLSQLITMAPLFLLWAIAMAILIGYGYPFLLMIILFFVPPYLVAQICSEWGGKQQAAVTLEQFQHTLLDKLQADSNPLMEHTKLKGTAAVETALVYSLTNRCFDPKRILKCFDRSVVTKVWICAVRMLNWPHNGQLMAGLLDAHKPLQEALKEVSVKRWKSEPELNVEEHLKQWKRVKPISPPWLASVVYLLLSALICFASSALLAATDPGYKLLLVKRGWILLLGMISAGLIPIKTIRYLSVLTASILPYVFLPEGWTLIDEELMLYSWFISFSLVLANYVLDWWTAVKKLYPSRQQIILGKCKAVLLFFGGSVAICLSFLLLMQMRLVINESTAANPGSNAVAALRNYAVIRGWPESPQSLYKSSLIESVGWHGSNFGSLYGMNLVHRIDHGNEIYETKQALNNFGYPEKGIEFSGRIMNYLGWTEARLVMTDGGRKSVYLDNTGKEIPVAIVITYMVSAGQAEDLGMKMGDIIESVNGQPVTAMEDVSQVLKSSGDNAKKIQILIRRDNQRLQFTVLPGRLGITMGAINKNCLGN